MRLFQLAYACGIYGVGFDSALSRFRCDVGPQFDIGDAVHRMRLLKWLNDWGCRHLAKTQHSMVSDALFAWAQTQCFAEMPSRNTPLLQLSNADIDAVGKCFDDLATRVAVERKTWDASIRQPANSSGLSYSDFLTRRVIPDARSLLADAARFGIPPEKLAITVGRPKASIAKLMDEYYWVTVSQGQTPPTMEKLKQWATWADLLPQGA